MTSSVNFSFIGHQFLLQSWTKCSLLLCKRLLCFITLLSNGVLQQQPRHTFLAGCVLKNTLWVFL